MGDVMHECPNCRADMIFRGYYFCKQCGGYDVHGLGIIPRHEMHRLHLVIENLEEYKNRVADCHLEDGQLTGVQKNYLNGYLDATKLFLDGNYSDDQDDVEIWLYEKIERIQEKLFHSPKIDI